MASFFGVLEHLARDGVDAHFVSRVAALYIEGVAETAGSLLLLQLFIGDGAG